MPMPEDFASECLYTPDAWFVDDVLELGPERVVGRLHTDRLTTLVTSQRPWPGHDRHLPGAVVIQMTATLGNLHAVYGLGLRLTEGWAGFGTHLESAKFPSMGVIGPPVDATLVSTRVRTVRGTKFLDYEFCFEQEGRVVHTSRQIAGWRQSAHRGPCPDVVARQ
jgi:hypothetical protein